jgi:hypothetical protein
MAQVIVLLPDKYEALSSNPVTLTKTKSKETTPMIIV